MKRKLISNSAAAIFIVTLLALSQSIYAKNIDPNNDGHQWSWGENVGWLNFEPLGQPGVTVQEYAVIGSVWGENIGWIYLNPPIHGGVTNDGHGNLGGNAWGENIGWISFSGSGYGVVIDTVTGQFEGEAWGENIGWINFSLPTAQFGVKTSWRPNKPPVANAGPDQNVECNATPTTVQLDGTGSSDPDSGDAIAAYQWIGGTFSPTDMVAKPTVNLDLGSHNFTLTVFDSLAFEDSDSVRVMVTDTVAPNITAPADIHIQHSYPLNNNVVLGRWLLTDDCDQGPALINDAPPDFPLGITTVNWTATDASDNSSSDNQVVELLNTAPVAYPQSVALNEDSSLGITLTANDVNGEPVTFTIIDGPNHGALSGSVPNITYTPVANYFGSDSILFEVSDPHETSSQATIDITISNVNDTPTIELSGDLNSSVQYSDGIGTITVTSSDIDNPFTTLATAYNVNGGVDISGLPAGLSVTDIGCKITTDNAIDPDGSSCTWTITGDFGDSEGHYEITATVSDLEPLSSSTTTTIEVKPENASIAFDSGNPAAVKVVTDGGNSGSFDLTVEITETLSDIFTFSASPGDIAKAIVSMTLSPVGPGQSAFGSCVTTSVDPISDGYTQAQTVLCTFDDVEVNTYSAIVTVNGGFYAGSSDDVLTVYDPSLGFASGGGWFYWPGTMDKTNFGSTMKYNKKATKVQGNLLLIRHLSDGSIFKVKSNALFGLALGEGTAPPYGWASFNGKATYLEPGWPEPKGSHEFVVYIEDRDEQGSDADRFWIEVTDKDGEVMPLSFSRDALTNAVEISSGNISVPNSGD